MENELWRWIWVGAAVFFGVAEIFTAGFFLLPFGIGAAVAAVLAWLNVHVVIQWIVFLILSVLSLIWLQRFAKRDDGVTQAIGANRYLGKRAIVLEPIDPMAGTGRVRVETEEWRATAQQPIAVGAEVRVASIDGARLVVVPNANDE